MVRCILWPQKTGSSLAKYQVCKSLIIDSGKNYYNYISHFMSVQLNNGAMNQYLVTVSKSSSFLICDAVLIGVRNFKGLYCLHLQRQAVQEELFIAFSTSLLLGQKGVKQLLS
jgi:hypothetical protein